ncbi:hypothetical protein ASC94_23305 [Massilia sp. Root418]|nr:hypothetical protein ASC94_23305 [Massilia sp. Root418]
MITELPAAPTRDDPDKFSERGDALMIALPPMMQQINALIPAIIDAAAAGTLAPAAQPLRPLQQVPRLHSPLQPRARRRRALSPSA